MKFDTEPMNRELPLSESARIVEQTIHNGKLSELSKRKDAQDWFAQLPKQLEQLKTQWNLQLLHAFPGSSVSLVIAAKCKTRPVVLKIQWPHPECEFEADALHCWNGNGAVSLLEHDRSRNALLVEHCLPGAALSQYHKLDRIGVVIDLLPKLWVPATTPFRTLAEEAASWAANLRQDWEDAGKPCEEMMIDAALDYIKHLSHSQSAQVLLHQDLHGDNLLASLRGGWLAIDPKPLVGEREFSPSPVIRSFEFGARKRDVIYRLDRLSAELGLDRERVRGWAFAQTIAWSFDSAHAEHHYRTARYLLQG